MHTITGKIERDIEIIEDTEIQGMVVGRVRVTSGVVQLKGMVAGHLLLEGNGIVNIFGMVIGEVVNRGGELNIYGMINGTLQKIAGRTWVDPNAKINSK